MANIIHPQAIKFANENARTIADLLGKLDRTTDQFLLNVVRDFETPTSGNANGDVISDGSEPAAPTPDGRPSVTKENVAQLKFVVEQIQAAMRQDDRQEIVNRWAVNTQPIY